MKLVFTARAKGAFPNVYLIRIPNYFDVDRVGALLSEVEVNCLDNEKVVEYQIFGDDALTLDERKQLDVHGKIISRPTEISCPQLIKNAQAS